MFVTHITLHYTCTNIVDTTDLINFIRFDLLYKNHDYDSCKFYSYDAFEMPTFKQACTNVM